MLKKFSSIFLALFTLTLNAGVDFTQDFITVQPYVVSYNPNDSYFYFTNVELGFDAWYDKNVYGYGSKVANIELGTYWNEHEYFSDTIKGTVIIPEEVELSSIYNYHATATAAIIAGYKKPATDSEEVEIDVVAAFGIAPAATLSAAAVASKITSDGTANIDGKDFCRAYKYFFKEESQDVINSSWGPLNDAPDSFLANYTDALSYANKHTTLVISAGNKEKDADGNFLLERVQSFAQAYNAISVGALDNPPTYDELASFSVTSPSDFYNPDTKEVIKNVRAAVDICAAGTNIVGAFYDAENPNTLDYQIMSGTSFSAPIVSGTIALMTSVSKQLEEDADFANAGWNADARDSRVIKAVLLNSADKLTDWNNGQSTQDGVEFKIEFDGMQGAYYTASFDNVIKTTQALDFNYGAGALNPERAFDQYLGLYINGNAENVWILDDVNYCSSNIYHIGEIEEDATLTMTLVWQAISEIIETTDEEGNISENITNQALSNLSLELWIMLDDGSFSPIAISDTEYNNVEHLSVTLAGNEDYYARVGFFEMEYGTTIDSETFALAWNIQIPEPAHFALTLSLATILIFIHRKKR